MKFHLGLFETVTHQHLHSVGAVVDEELGLFEVFASEGCEDVADDAAAIPGGSLGGLGAGMADAGSDAMVIRANTLID